MTDTVKSRSAFVSILEKALYELYDHHCNLSTNTPISDRLVPTSTDLWAEYIHGKPLITEVRRGTGADSSGIHAGMEIIAINDIPVQQAVQNRLPLSLAKPDTAAASFILRLLLAGDHITTRKLSLKDKNIIADFYPDQNGMGLERIQYSGMVETRFYQQTGYIRINNCLYDNGLIAVFDSVMQLMQHTKALILDLRETPSGGNTSVARAILSWFISKKHFYQQHEYAAEEKQTGIKRSWQEIVSPRPGKYYSRPLVILVNHWTGSIAEGISIGFDALQRPNTVIIGTAMSRLNGAVYSYEMPWSKIGFNFTAEKLYHINGTPRELFLPEMLVATGKLRSPQSADIFISVALNYLRRKQ